MIPNRADVRSWLSRTLGMLVPRLGRAGKPPRGFSRVFVDQRTGRLHVVDASGTVVDLEAVGRLPTTAGGLLYFDGARLRVLAIGSSGQVLTESSGLPSWAAAGGGGGGTTDPSLLAQVSIREDWISAVSNWPGTFPWKTYRRSGGSWAHVAPTTSKEVGILRLQSGGTGSVSHPRGMVAHLDMTGAGVPFYGLPEGLIHRAKMRIESGSALINCWSGLSSYSPGWADVAVAQTLKCITVMARDEAGSTSYNWVGCVRDGSAETTVDLGVAADGTWRDLGWRITSTPGVQFQVAGADVGSEVTSNLPAASTTWAPTVGAYAHSTLASLYCDIHEFTGGISRI